MYEKSFMDFFAQRIEKSINSLVFDKDVAGDDNIVGLYRIVEDFLEKLVVFIRGRKHQLNLVYIMLI